MMSKKADLMDNLIFLIIAGLSLLIALSLFISFGFFGSLSPTIGVTLTTLESNLRGALIRVSGQIFLLVIGLLVFISLTSRMCYSFPVGTAVCAAMVVALTATTGNMINNLQSSIPYIDIPIADINMPSGHTICGDNQQIEPEAFYKEISQRIVDCWIMYAESKYDPLAAKVPPNPRTCFTVNFNLNGIARFSRLKDYMETHNYSEGVTYWDRIKGRLILENDKGEDQWESPIQVGRIYIKYGDKIFNIVNPASSAGYKDFYSPDCSISTSYSAPGGIDDDQVYLCVDEAASYANNRDCDDGNTKFGWI